MIISPDLKQISNISLAYTVIFSGSIKGLEHTGSAKLCRLDPQVRQLLAENLMLFVNERVGWEKQLTGGIVILDDIPTMRETGKMDKSYLRSLTEKDVVVYGDQSGN